MRIQTPIVGAMTGSAGKLIFQHYYGHTYGRSKPVIFHYGPTENQKITQDAYYFVQKQWLSIFHEMKPYIPVAQFKYINPYSCLLKGILEALQTFRTTRANKTVSKFGFDKQFNQKIVPGSYQVTYYENKERIIYDDINYTTKVEFTPQIAHALYLNPNTQHIQYQYVAYHKANLAFDFDNESSKSNDLPILYYLALSDGQYFSDFFK